MQTNRKDILDISADCAELKLYSVLCIPSSDKPTVVHLALEPQIANMLTNRYATLDDKENNGTCVNFGTLTDMKRSVFTRWPGKQKTRQLACAIYAWIDTYILDPDSDEELESYCCEIPLRSV